MFLVKETRSYPIEVTEVPMKLFAIIFPLLAVAIGVTSLCEAKNLHVPQQFPSIQAAIDQANEGDIVLVSPGVYNERIEIAPRVTVRSIGGDEQGRLGILRAENTILDGGGKAEAVPGVTMAEGATLDGFTVTNVGLYDEALWDKHHATQGNEQSHEQIGHFGSPAIGIVRVTCTVANNIVHHNGDTGIGIRGTKDRACSPRVVHNFCYRNMGGGIGSMEGSTAIINGNHCFQNFYAGIGHAGASPIVTNNTCYENIRAGIGISDGASPIVRRNNCYGNRRAGIGVRTGKETSPVIEDNECYENDMAGIGCEENATPIIRNNRCYRNAMAGIGARGGAQPLIVNNTCYENSMAGIGLSDETVAVIVRNNCRENEMAGIGVSSTAHAVVCHNQCLENKLVAIGLPDGATAVIHGNEVSRSEGAPPLIAIKGGSSAILSENSIRGGGVAGVLIEGRATLINNRLQGKGPEQGSAVWIWKGSSVTIANNKFDGYRNAVNADGSQVLVCDNEIRGFENTAIIVKRSSHPAHVFGNTAVSNNAADKPVIVEGELGVVSDNRLISDR
jgi:parallel beta-helix repeat protein